MEQIKKVLENIKNTSSKVIAFSDKGDFHHNAPYEHGLSILKNGILTNANQSKYGINRPTHVNILGYMMPIDTTNGNDKISLARMIDEEPYDGQDFMYDAYRANLVDFVIDENIRKDIPFGHCNDNYYNEYLVRRDIPRKYIKSLNVRFHNMLLLKDKKFHYPMNEEIFLANYNHFIDMARYIVGEGLPISIEEVVNNDTVYVLNPNEVINLEKVKIR